MPKIIYTGLFVDKPEELLRLIPVRLEGHDLKIHAHHVTKEFRPKNGLENLSVGHKQSLTAYAQVTTKNIQAVLVRSDDARRISINRYPHITIATANGASPSESNTAIEESLTNGSIVNFENPISIETTEGYFDGSLVHTTMSAV